MEKKQYYFVEYTDGRIEKFEGQINPGALGEGVEAAYTVATVYAKQSVFQATDLVGKGERRVRMPDGSLKLKADMTDEEKAWYSEVRSKAAQRAATSRKANAAS